ncbi:MAG: phosphotransferase [Planctomycetota bacterium]|nr:phosphotransferase [Planctomycetota bacterium]
MSTTTDWPEGAEAWVRAALAPAAVHVTRAGAAPRSWLACLEDGDARWYFKEDQSHGPSEASVLRRLAERRSADIAVVVALDEAHGWSLTRDAGRPLRVEDPTELWCTAVRRLGELQVSETPHTEEWRMLRCRDLSGDHLFTAIQGLFTAAFRELERDVCDALRSLTPRIEEACATLTADPVPDTLVHRDIVPENVLVSDSGPTLLDWSDVVVGHPFFACDRLLDSCWTDAVRKAAVIDAYLSAFGGVTDRDTLRRSFDAVLFLRVVYEGVRWLDEIESLDPGSAHAGRLWADALSGLRAMAGAFA